MQPGTHWVAELPLRVAPGCLRAVTSSAINENPKLIYSKRKTKVEKVIDKQAAHSHVNSRTLIAGWLLIVGGIIPLLAFTGVLIFAMLTTDFASGATFNLDIFSGLAVLVGTPCLIALLVGVSKIKLYRQFRLETK